MFGVRLSSLFTSRWFALLWAVLVILTALEFVGVGDDGAGNGADNLTAEQRDAIANAF
ncbi:hypothetical protein [Sphingobium fontiphilum]|uniref:hypothetical protein n=1 Tax=Sphingobium fontiphilum TaxID=944425 RepID=UPI00161819FD|nr:hypothetical protein [Sphingobium fontiphilum]